MIKNEKLILKTQLCNKQQTLHKPKRKTNHTQTHQSNKTNGNQTLKTGYHKKIIGGTKKMRYFNFKLAKQIIANENIKNADGGIMEDYESTAAPILKNGVWIKNHDATINSTWGTPVLKDIDTGNVYIVKSSKRSVI